MSHFLDTESWGSIVDTDSVSIQPLLDFIEDLGSFAVSLQANLSTADYRLVEMAVSKPLVVAVEKIALICA